MDLLPLHAVCVLGRQALTGRWAVAMWDRQSARSVLQENGTAAANHNSYSELHVQRYESAHSHSYNYQAAAVSRWRPFWHSYAGC